MHVWDRREGGWTLEREKLQKDLDISKQDNNLNLLQSALEADIAEAQKTLQKDIETAEAKSIQPQAIKEELGVDLPTVQVRGTVYLVLSARAH